MPRSLASVAVLTYSDVDHIGNMNLFPDATFIGGNDVIQGDLFKVDKFIDIAKLL